MIPTNIITWFEIPVANMDRAIKFYETVFQFTLQRNTMGVLDMAWFPNVNDGKGISGSLVCYPDFYQPSEKGSLLYFASPTDNLTNEMERVDQAGGSVLQEKKLIADNVGYMGLFLDTEGNRMAMHSSQ